MKIFKAPLFATVSLSCPACCNVNSPPHPLWSNTAIGETDVDEADRAPAQGVDVPRPSVPSINDLLAFGSNHISAVEVELPPIAIMSVELFEKLISCPATDEVVVDHEPAAPPAVTVQVVLVVSSAQVIPEPAKLSVVL